MAIPVLELDNLYNELISDPMALGYAPLIAANNWQALADLLNLPHPGDINYSVTFNVIERERLLECLDIAECEVGAPNGPTLAQLGDLLFQMESDYDLYLATFDPENLASGYLSTHLKGFVFGPTREALDAVQQGYGSRAESQWWHLLKITPQQCEDAISVYGS